MSVGSGNHGKHKRKLTADQVASIRLSRALGSKLDVMSMVFGIHKSTVSRICKTLPT
jgi:hypothetical protein